MPNSGESKCPDSPPPTAVTEESWGDPGLTLLLQSAARSWSSDAGYAAALGRFREEHASEFEGYVSEPDSEHRLHFPDLHREYLAMFESQITEFVTSSGYTVADFFQECREAADGFGVALFDDREEKWFVDAMMEALDYSSWFERMVEEARRGG
eukprot:CAMPEP_0182467226 /NCGR_PEP_ID=MMETSP1319-20130603/13481_1 /TAXON_ID=172717 /ORGANISM="Bolidomonas pacifica, Strain RCC208" /LENGTH=153 /DNA_ID=CAMNT_0024667289 /DNA_START=262 /DNA_END=719 /DNA_ORIENTATION=+